MLVWILIIVVVAIITWYGYLKPYSYWKRIGVSQTKPWIIFGDAWPTLFRRMTVLEWFNWFYYMHPGTSVTGMYQFYLPTLIVKDPEVIKQITVKDFDYFTDHNTFAISEDVDLLWSKNLFALKGQRWREMRALLSGSFTSSKMKTMYLLISEASENFVNHFITKNQDYIDVEIKDLFTRYTNDVIASTSFGIKVDSLENPTNEFYLMGKEATNFTGFTMMVKFIMLMLFPPLCKILKIGVFSSRVTKFFTSLIMETIKVREEQGIVRPDMINLLLEVKKGIKQNEDKEVIDTGFAVVQESLETVKPQKRYVEITDSDIVSQAMIFFLAGFDSSSTAMSFTCYELAVNPDIQDKLRKEIKETMNENGGQLTYEVLLKMKYLDMVVTESLRKWPINAFADRMCTKPYTLKFPNTDEPTVEIKKDMYVMIPTISIQRDPKYFPEPEKFIPERFSDENKGNIKPYTYMPFGVGPRACIGSRFALLEIKSVLCHLIINYEIVPSKKTVIPLKLIKESLMVLPEKGFHLGLKRITCNN